MVPVGQAYSPAGGFDARSILTTVILGTVTAILGAALIWAWEISPIPTLVFLTPLFQGVIVGQALAFMVGRPRLRNPRLLGVIGFCCGLLSITLVHYGHHLRLVSRTAREARAQIAARQTVNAEQRRELLARIDADPEGFVDTLLVEHTGSKGLLGSLKLRNAQEVTIKGHATTGLFLWLLWSGEALLVAIMASAMASGRAKEPFCEECCSWCIKQPDLLVLPGPATDTLVVAVREDNQPGVKALRAEPGPDDGSGKVGVTLHACPYCDQCFADVSHRVRAGDQLKVTNKLHQIRVSPEMVAVLRGQLDPEPGAENERELATSEEFPASEATSGD